MAVTSLTVNGQGSATSVVALSGNAVQATNTVVRMAHPLHTVYTNAIQSIVAQYKNKPLLKTIQGGIPFADGTFFIHGDACTTVLAQLDPQDMQDSAPIQVPANGLAIIDQCPACNDCDTKWSILQRIQTLQLILAAYKDNQLVQNDQALVRWKAMDALRITQNDTANSCSSAPDMDQRIDFVLPARRLFIQYKALVQMWNYLADYGNRRLKIRHAAGHSQGIALSAQYRTSKCYSEQASLRLTMQLSITAGQVGSDAAGVYIPEYGRLRLYVGDIQSEHALQSGTATDVTDTVSVKLDALPQESDAVCAADRIEISQTFTDLHAITRSGVSLNIIPVYIAQQKYPTTIGPEGICTTNEYYRLQRNATQLVLDKGLQNTWKVHITWYLVQSGVSTKLSQQTKYYTTKPCSVPRNTSYVVQKSTAVYQDASGFYINNPDRVQVWPALGNNDLYYYYDTGSSKKLYIKDSRS